MQPDKNNTTMQEDIKQALTILRNGGIILYPTDTIWGIGCDATNEKAVARVYEIKQREDSKSMLVLIDAVQRIYSYVREVPSLAIDLIDVTDNPLTIIYSGAKNLAGNLTEKDGTIGIRVTTDEFCIRLINAFGKPIVSTSANISGQPHPENFDAVSPEIRTAVDYVVEWRQDDYKKAKPSSIIKLGVGGEIEIIRK
jgi:L-threonylcarbamoyladenylate synthase